jgi:hypothetical protein
LFSSLWETFRSPTARRATNPFAVLVSVAIDGIRILLERAIENVGDSLFQGI